MNAINNGHSIISRQKGGLVYQWQYAAGTVPSPLRRVREKRLQGIGNGIALTSRAAEIPSEMGTGGNRDGRTRRLCRAAGML